MFPATAACLLHLYARQLQLVLVTGTTFSAQVKVDQSDSKPHQSCLLCQKRLCGPMQRHIASQSYYNRNRKQALTEIIWCKLADSFSPRFGKSPDNSAHYTNQINKTCLPYLIKFLPTLGLTFQPQAIRIPLSYDSRLNVISLYQPFTQPQ